MQFIDRVEIRVKAGDGGDGVVAWLREAHMEFGGPAGGEGGRGGSVYFIGDSNLTLFPFRYANVIEAPGGLKGGTKNKSGRAGEDVKVSVPLGTLLIDQQSGRVLFDFDQHGKAFLVARGGLGGRGNASFLSNLNKAPRMFERGELGQERKLVLELMVLADVGLVGAPNAGKSTLLSKVSAARPKIANYPFTTLTPVLGVVNLKGGRQFVMADIPGLIEGAAHGAGLGTEFLRHVERCRCLLHLVSMDEMDGEDPYKTFTVVSKELKTYKDLAAKPAVVVATKMDAAGAAKRLAAFKKKVKQDVWAISALVDEDEKQLTEQAYALFIKNKPPVLFKEERLEHKDYVFDEQNPAGKDLAVSRREDGVWTAQSPRLQYWYHRIPMSTPDNVVRFNQKMESEGVFAKMKAMGAKPGETLDVYGTEFVYED